jgi:hypothetical protein
MRLVSFGTACSVRYQIDKYYRHRNIPLQPTFFFDWLMSSDYSILRVLSIPAGRLKSLLSHSLFKKIGTKHGNAILKVSGLDLYSIHDVSEQVYPREMDALIDKYHRRHIRLLSALTSRDRIHCIRKKNCSDAFVKKLHRLLRHCNYILVLIYPFPENTTTQTYIYNKNIKCIRINLSCFKRRHPSDWADDPDWADRQYDWTRIFDLLNTIY